MSFHGKVWVPGGALAAGIVFGCLVTYWFMSWAGAAISDGEEKVHDRSEVMTPYTLLTVLRQNQPEAAIRILEANLDVGLYTMAIKAENDTLAMDSELQQLLDRIREYRAKHPGAYASEAMRQKVEAFLKK